MKFLAFRWSSSVLDEVSSVSDYVHSFTSKWWNFMQRGEVHLEGVKFTLKWRGPPGRGEIHLEGVKFHAKRWSSPYRGEVFIEKLKFTSKRFGAEFSIPVQRPEWFWSWPKFWSRPNWFWSWPKFWSRPNWRSLAQNFQSQFHEQNDSGHDQNFGRDQTDFGQIFGGSTKSLVNLPNPSSTNRMILVMTKILVATKLILVKYLVDLPNIW